MTVPPDIVGQFVDAAVRDRRLADDFLQRHPDLRLPTWVGHSLLRFLAIENHAQGIDYLAGRGWMIDESDDDGTTPLIEAVCAGARQAVMTFFDLGADPNAVSDTYDNALHCAIFAGDTKMVRILLNRGANPAYTTDVGETAFDVIPNKPEKNSEIRAMLAERGLFSPDA